MQFTLDGSICKRKIPELFFFFAKTFQAVSEIIVLNLFICIAPYLHDCAILVYLTNCFLLMSIMHLLPFVVTFFLRAFTWVILVLSCFFFQKFSYSLLFVMFPSQGNQYQLDYFWVHMNWLQLIEILTTNSVWSITWTLFLWMRKIGGILSSKKSQYTGF